MVLKGGRTKKFAKQKSLGFVWLLFLIFIFPLHAQKEASQYFYWKDSGIKFNKQGIEAYTNTNNISHIQAGKDFSPVLCDTAGNLLMYTNMETIYDRSGNVMENGTGLLANRNGIQGAVWVDLPASRGRYYYLFYSDAQGTAFGIFLLMKDDGITDATLLRENDDVRDYLVEVPTGPRLVTLKKENDHWYAAIVTIAKLASTPSTSV
jgi:hypothetical protein